MARNASGTYSLPSGNPVVSGTTIASTTHNTTQSDIATELTDSLSRSGKGAMLAALELANGTVGTPALSFDSDTDCGLYRAGANNPAIAAGGVKAMGWTGSGVEMPLPVTTALTASVGATVTQSTTNGSGVTTTGNGTGPGVTATGGATGAGIVASGGVTSGNGGTFTGTGTSGDGINATGKGTGQGVDAHGGDNSGTGVDARGGAPNGIGLYAEGSGTGQAIEAHGYISLTGGNPASTVAVSNGIAATSVIKVHGSISFNVSSATVSGGFNLTSAAIQSSSVVRITFATAFANTNYSWSAHIEAGVGDFAAPCIPYLSTKNASYIELKFYALGGALVTSVNTTGAFQLNFIATGAQ